MKKLKRLLAAVMTVVCVIALSGNAAFASNHDVFAEETSVYNEYEAATTGKSDSEIMEINRQYAEFIYDLKENYSENELSIAGYSENQIVQIKSYDGDYNTIRAIAATVSLSQSISNYNYSNGATSAKISFTASWSGIPFWQFRDAICVAWSEGLYVQNSYVKATYKSTRNSSTMSYTAPCGTPHVSKETLNLGNTAVAFKFAVNNGTRYILKKVTGYVTLSKLSYVNEFSCLVSYGQSVIVVSPTVTVGISGTGPSAGLSISFSFGCNEIATSLKHYTL